MWRSLWQTPAALTLTRTCVPDGCGVGWSTSFKGALKSATWKLFIASLPSIILDLERTWPRLQVPKALVRPDQWTTAGVPAFGRYGRWPAPGGRLKRQPEGRWGAP